MATHAIESGEDLALIVTHPPVDPGAVAETYPGIAAGLELPALLETYSSLWCYYADGAAHPLHAWFEALRSEILRRLQEDNG